MALEDRLKERGITIVGGVPEQLEVLDPNGDALFLIADLQDAFGERHAELLAQREKRYAEFDDGKLPDFLPETRHIREDKTWRVTDIPDDLLYRWAELTGPANSARMVAGALNSGANTWMADYEDALSPLWENILANTFNLYNAITRQREFNPDTGEFNLNEDLATIITRPRGLHLPEAHMLVDGQPVSATMFDLGMVHSILTPDQMRRGQTPANYLPKIEHYEEGGLLSNVLDAISNKKNIPKGTIKVSILIEQILATFQVAEILHAMKDYAMCANVGRWDQTASWYRAFRNHPNMGLPDRQLVTMMQPFMIAYQKEPLRVCYERGAQPMGGMEANVPTGAERQSDPEAYSRRIDAVKADARREAEIGFYGKWSAHPATVQLIKEVFEEVMDGKPSQPYKFEHEPNVTQQQLLELPQGARTYEGMVDSAEEGIGYGGPWLNGTGAVALKGRMVDLATAEITREELGHRAKHGTVLDDGRIVTPELARQAIQEAGNNIRNRMGPEAFEAGKFPLAMELFQQAVELGPRYVPDLGYRHLVLSSGKG